MHNHVKHNMPFDVNEAMKSNILITGTNQQGKSLLAMGIADILSQRRPLWQILVFDNVGHWKQKSSLPVFQQISEVDLRFALPDCSIIYDISLLLPTFQKEFCENVLNEVWKRQVTQNRQRWILVIFEESQLYMKNVRGNISQNILRIMSVGANWKIRCLGITPDLSLIDCAFIRLCGQRYHFKLGNEPNAKRRFNSYYGSDYTRVCKELDVGFCLYYLNEKLKVCKIPLYRQWRQPKDILTLVPQKPSLKQRIIQMFSNSRSKTAEEEFEEEEEENQWTEEEEEDNL